MWKLQKHKLLEHGMKVIERIFERTLLKVVELDEMQMGFMPGRGTTDAIFIMRCWKNMKWPEESLYGICGF